MRQENSRSGRRTRLSVGGRQRRYNRLFFHAKVAELVDAPDLGSDAARHEGSSPSLRTNRSESASGNMAANVENLGTLERRVSMSVPVRDIEKQVDARLKQLARKVKMPGFRPGKVPMKIVAQTYGPQVRNEVLGDAVQKSFSDVVKQANLRVAGYPKIEKKDGAGA